MTAASAADPRVDRCHRRGDRGRGRPARGRPGRPAVRRRPLLAYLLDPLVERFARVGVPRWLAVLLVYAITVGVVVLASRDRDPAARPTQIATFTTELPDIVRAIQYQLDHLNELYDRLGLPAGAAHDRGFASSAGGGSTRRTTWTSASCARSSTAPASFVTSIFGYLILPAWLFFLLKDRPRLAGRDGPFPADGLAAATPGRSSGSSTRSSASGSAASSSSARVVGAGLVHRPDDPRASRSTRSSAGSPSCWRSSPALGELIPIIGPIISAVPAVLLGPDRRAGAGACGPAAVPRDPAGREQLPRAQDPERRDRPPPERSIITALVIGGAIFGLLGAILALPVTAAFRDVFKYVFRRAERDRRRRAEGGPSTPARSPRWRPPAAGSPWRPGRSGPSDGPIRATRTSTHTRSSRSTRRPMSRSSQRRLPATRPEIPPRRHAGTRGGRPDARAQHGIRDPRRRRPPGRFDRERAARAEPARRATAGPRVRWLRAPARPPMPDPAPGDRRSGPDPGPRRSAPRHRPQTVSRDWTSGRSTIGGGYDPSRMRTADGDGRRGAAAGRSLGDRRSTSADTRAGHSARSPGRDLEYLEWLDRMADRSGLPRRGRRAAPEGRPAAQRPGRRRAPGAVPPPLRSGGSGPRFRRVSPPGADPTPARYHSARVCRMLMLCRMPEPDRDADQRRAAVGDERQRDPGDRHDPDDHARR